MFKSPYIYSLWVVDNDCPIENFDTARELFFYLQDYSNRVKDGMSFSFQKLLYKLRMNEPIYFQLDGWEYKITRETRP